MGRVLIYVFIFAVSLAAFEESKGTYGYGRVQTSFQNDKENVCFKLDGAQTKYRLGNECETWLELGIYQDIEFDNGVKIHNQIMPSFYGANESSVDFVRWEDVYSEVFNIFDSNSVSFWLGRRYYKRYDSHISDYFFFNMGGTGLGVDNFEIYKDLTLSYSYIYDDLKDDSFEAGESLRFNSHDLRLKKKYENSELILFVNYMNFSDKRLNSGYEIKSSDGYALGILYKSKNIYSKLLDLKGQNIAAAFYGSGAARSAGQNSSFLQDDIVTTMIQNDTTIKSAKTFRFINYNALQNDTFGVMSNLVYQTKNETEFSLTRQNWFSAGVRVYYFTNKNMRILNEIGYDNVYDEINKESYYLSKITPAFEFALKKGIWSRPVLRVYFTYAKWSHSAKGKVAADYYQNSTSGTNAGIQLEYWW